MRALNAAGSLLLAAAYGIWIPIFVDLGARWWVPLVVAIVAAVLGALRQAPGLLIVQGLVWAFIVYLFVDTDAGALEWGIAAAPALGFLLAAFLTKLPRLAGLALAAGGLTQATWVVTNIRDDATNFVPGNVAFTVGCLLVAASFWLSEAERPVRDAAKRLG